MKKYKIKLDTYNILFVYCQYYIMEDKMDKITYERDVEGNSRETTKIDFEFESDLTIKEFKRLCVRLAYSLGYGEKSIKESFGVGELKPDQDIEGFRKLLLDGMTNGR